MRRRGQSARAMSHCRCCDLMQEELSHALVEALYELEVLPENEEGALVGVYAVMDDLRAALDHTERLDHPLAQSA